MAELGGSNIPNEVQSKDISVIPDFPYRTQLIISPETFLKENKYESPDHRIAYAPDGSKYFVKTANMSSQQEIEDYSGRFAAEEAAWKIATELGAPMAETRIVTIENIPWIAARFIEDAQDNGYGYRLHTDSSSMRQDLARIAVFKYIIGGGGENGQYLAVPGEGRAYAQDIGVGYPPYNTIRQENGSTTAAELLHNFLYQSDEIFGNGDAVMAAQLDEIAAGHINDIFDQAEKLSRDFLSAVINNCTMFNPDERKICIEWVQNRASQARIIFSFLARHKELTMCALNPSQTTDQTGAVHISYTTNPKSLNAKVELLELFAQRQKHIKSAEKLLANNS